DVTQSVISNSGGVMYVYGILEDFDDLGDAPLTWNTAPGVMNNPTPAVGSPVEVDTSEAVELFAFEGLPSGDTRAVSDPSQALSDFMSEDTDGIITLMFAPRDGSSVILRSSVRWNNANAGTFLEGFVGGTPKAASKPNPDNALTDVYRDTTLSWTPGGYAGSHDVYLSTIFNDVNDASRTAQMGALISQGQEATSLVPGRLDLGATYYWRVDEVNSAPDNTIFKGSVWSFTVEPKSYVLGSDAIQATASSSNVEAMPGDKTADGSGLTGDLHSTQSTDMWLSKIIIEGIVPEPSLTYEFDSLYQLDTMKVWNYNGTGEASVGWGAKDVLVESSLNGMDWVAVDSITQFNRADGMAPTGPTDTFELNGLTAKYLKISILSNWGGILNQYGLGEVQFTFVPTSARYPSPEMDAVEVDPLDVLTWRPGREAAQHVVSIGSDPEALGEGVTLNSNQAAMSDLGLQMAQTYYWTVDEVNDAEDPAVYPGDLWTFSTQEFFVVDDFERYTNFSPDRPFQTWLDGFGYSADEYFPVKFDGNGTGAGIGHDIWSPTSPHLAGDIMETDTVHSGSKAMPFYFTSAGSHTDRTFALPQDWTRAGATTLVIYFFGSPGSTGQLYATINNAKVNYSGHAANLSLPVWTQWNIDLVSINTNLQNIQTLSLGVDGNASGMILVDDIRLYVTAPPLPAEVVWVEAESGSVTAPMQVFPDSETPGASGTGYVSCPVGTADEGTAPTYPAGTLTVPFTVAGGVYTARFRVAFVGGDDSCWVRIPDAAIDSAVDASGWIHFNDIPLGETWHWSQAVKSENQGGEPPVQFTLSAGTHNIEIAYRGAELKIDAIEFSLVE
ncbi:MAG: DUF4457 domain-containing protein, partial [Phycisphaerae bacterium]|nr:DUF4457 domain-containing protein [Phycisphaerae bacterium]